jgi:hypothetical protein
VFMSSIPIVMLLSLDERRGVLAAGWVRDTLTKLSGKPDYLGLSAVMLSSWLPVYFISVLKVIAIMFLAHRTCRPVDK